MTSMTLKTDGSAADSLAIDNSLVSELLIGFIRDEVRKVGFDKVVIGVSGGVDSALVLALCARALGPENVHAVLMPYRTSAQSSADDAVAACQAFGVEYEVVDISPAIDAYFSSQPEAGRARRGNKMARERMSVLYDLSFARDALVVGTSNKSELLLGYGTVYGDMAHALNPIGDLYKTQVFSLSAYLGVPDAILNKPPSADLWEGQSDEADLGFTYADVDAVLVRLVDERYSPDELLNLGFDADLVAEVMRRIRGSQYKRRLPVIAKLGGRTIDRDFRYPRDWGR
jgi:NAD+ synthase